MNEKKRIENLQKFKKAAIRNLREVEEFTVAANEEEKPSKKEKLLFKAADSRETARRYVERFLDIDGDVQEIISELNPFQLSVFEKLFPKGIDKEELEIKKEIDYYKEKIRNIKTYRAVDPYEEDWPMEKKRKSKFHHAQRNLESRLTLRSDENSHEYVDIWNYVRDYESTKDKYFTQEEQEEIKEALRVGAEYLDWYAEKYPKRVAMGGKLVKTGIAIGEWGELTQAKMDAKNLAEDVFPVAVEQIRGSLSKAEKMEEARLMTRRYIDYRRDPKREERALVLAKDAIRKAEAMVNDMCDSAEEESKDMRGITGMVLNLLVDKVEDEMKDKTFIQASALELLQAEYGPEEARFIMLLNHEKYREDRTRWLTKYSFEELGI